MSTVRDAARALMDKMDRVTGSDAYMSVWMIAQLHNGPYSGEQWVEERNTLAAALDAEDDAAYLAAAQEVMDAEVADEDAEELTTLRAEIATLTRERDEARAKVAGLEARVEEYREKWLQAAMEHTNYATAAGEISNGQLETIAILRAEVERLTRERDEALRIIGSDAECLPTCDSYGHAEGCPYADVMANFLLIKKERDEARATIAKRDAHIEAIAKDSEGALAEHFALRAEVERLRLTVERAEVIERAARKYTLAHDAHDALADKPETRARERTAQQLWEEVEQARNEMRAALAAYYGKGEK